MLTREELSDEDVMVYYDVVQSVASTKLITAYDEEKVEVIAYTDDDSKGQMWIYEIVLTSEIDPEEGDEISELLFNEFDDIQFTFEASVEV